MDYKNEVIQEFKLLIKDSVRNIGIIVKTAEELGLTNAQFYIDFEDFLNKISNLDHNIGIDSIINKQ